MTKLKKTFDKNQSVACCRSHEKTNRKLLSHAHVYDDFSFCVSVPLPPPLHPLHPLLRLFVSGEAVFARCLSSLKEERVEASRSLSGPQGVKFQGDKAVFLEDIRKVKHVKNKRVACCRRAKF